MTTQPMEQASQQASTPPQPPPAAPPERPRPRASRPSTRRKLAPLGPVILAGLLMLAIAELMLFRAPLAVALWVNLAAVLLVLIVWAIRRRASRRARRGAPSRRDPGGARQPGMPRPGSTSRGGLRGFLGRTFGGGRRGGASPTGRTGSGPTAGGGRGRTPGGGLGAKLGGLFGRSRNRSSGVPGGRLPGRAGARSPGVAGGPGGGQGSASSRGRGGLLGRIFGAGKSKPSTSGRPPGSRPSPGPRPGGAGSSGPRSRGGLVGSFLGGFRKGAGPSARRPGQRPAPALGPLQGPTRPPATAGLKPGAVTPPKTSAVRPTGPRTPGQPGGPSSSGGSMDAGQHGADHRQAEEQSLFKFGEGLRQAPDLFEDFARGLDRWARSGEEDQPLTEAVTAQIRAAAAVVRGLGTDSAEWYGSYRRSHESDVTRTEAPRKGSRTVEKKADVTAYERDA